MPPSPVAVPMTGHADAMIGRVWKENRRGEKGEKWGVATETHSPRLLNLEENWVYPAYPREEKNLTSGNSARPIPPLQCLHELPSPLFPLP